MIRRPPRSTRTDTLFPTRRSSDIPRRQSMTHMTRDDFARLLARARTVIADAAPTAHILCDELAQAERLVQDHVVPWPADIHTAFIDHLHGGDQIGRAHV